ncbi:MAG: bifunctional precorrin-2 dehydrogenase/sirohydrochlorin ferrochelatase [Acidaminococcaceae bacterium]|jgi:precorrin-2 dehydrogenase/sirohydrochlorin ferrochelatase|nr:bifunctional precorrin-2 dehydrogenase/sirohydrochlorin ferrochelatase [Acidaminococcaceae bacterium]
MSAYLDFNYPLQLKLQNKYCLVIGGGKVAVRKVGKLLAAGARVTVIATRVIPALQALAQQQRLNLCLRPYLPSDLKGAFLVVAATDDAAVNARVAQDAEPLQLLVNVVDAPELGNFNVPGTYDLGQLTFTVATGGNPLLTRLLLQDLQADYGPDLAAFAAFLSSQRGQVQRLLPTPADRKEFWCRVLTKKLLQQVKTGQLAAAEKNIRAAVEQLKK